jgi:HK97 family phage major capsid protein
MAAVDINRGTSGVNLPNAVASEIWAATVQASAVMQAARQINLPGAGVSIPLVTGDAAAAWVAESEEKSVSRATLDNKTMTPYTLAVIEPFSNQFRRDLPALYSELVRRLPFALGKVFDQTVFGTTTAPGSNFDQLTTAPTLTVDGTSTFGDLAAVLNAVAAEGAELTGWIVSPSAHGLMLTAVDTLGRQFFINDPANSSSVGSVFGAPVLRTRATMPTGAGATADKIGYAGDWAGSAVWGSVEGVQIAISDQATLQDGATSINLWQRNMFAVRAEIEVGFRVRDVNHFVSLNDGTADGS